MTLAFVEFSLDNAKLLSGLKRTQQKLRAFGQSIQSVGSSMVMAGTMAAAPFALSAKTFADFEQAMARVLALTNAAPDDFKRLNDEAKRLGVETVYTATQAAEAMGRLAQSGFSVNEIMGATASTLDLAIVGELELAESARITAGVLRGMGLETSDLGHVVDVLAKAMTTANTDLEEIGTAFRYVGPIAKTAGVRLEEVAASVQILSDAGMRGEMAGTTLRGMLVALTSPSVEAARELKRLGVTVNDARGNFRGITSIVAELEKAYKGMGSGARLGSLGIIFANRQAGGAAELTTKGVDALIEKTRQLQDSSGTAARISAVQLDTLKGAMLILKSNLENLAITIGESIAPILREWSKDVTAIAQAMRNWAGQNPEVARTLMQVVAAVIIVGGVLVALGLSIKLVAFALGGMAFAFSAIGVTILAILSPIGLIVVTLAKMASGLIKVTDKGRKAWADLKDGFAQVAEFMGKTWQGIVNAIKKGDLALAGQIAMAALQVVWIKQINFLKEKWTAFRDFFIDLWAKATTGVALIFNGLWAGIQKGWAETVAFMERTWARFANTIDRILEPASVQIEEGAKKAESVLLEALEAKGDDLNVAQKQERDRLRQKRDQGLLAPKKDPLQEELNRIEADRQKRIGEINADQEGIAGQLMAMHREGENARAAAAKAEQNEAQRRLDAALAEWQRLIDMAGAEAGGIGGNIQKALAGAVIGAGRRGDLEGGIAATGEQAFRPGSAKGTFNVAAIAGFAGGNVEQKQLDELREVKKDVKRLVREAVLGAGLVFG